MIKTILTSLLLVTTSPTMNSDGSCKIDWKKDSIPYFQKNEYKVGAVDKATFDKLVKSAIDEGVDATLLKGAKIYFAKKGTEHAGIGSFWIIDTHGCLVAKAAMTLQDALDILGKGA